MSNPNLPFSASHVGIMSPSDNKPMASDEDETMHSDEDETMHSDGPRHCIFWDVEDLPIPNGADPVSIYERMKTFLEVGDFSIILYVDDKEMMRYDAFKKAPRFTVLSREGIVHAGAYFMLLDIAMWTSDNPCDGSYPLLMVISKQIKKTRLFLNYFYRLASQEIRVLLTLDNLSRPHNRPVEEYPLFTVSLERLRTSLEGVEPSSDNKRKSIEEAEHSTSSLRQKVDESR